MYREIRGVTPEWATVIVGLSSALLLFLGQVVVRVWGHKEVDRSEEYIEAPQPVRFECGAMDNRGLLRQQFDGVHGRIDRLHSRLSRIEEGVDDLLELSKGHDRLRRQTDISRLRLESDREQGDEY